MASWRLCTGLFGGIVFILSGKSSRPGAGRSPFFGLALACCCALGAASLLLIGAPPGASGERIARLGALLALAAGSMLAPLWLLVLLARRTQGAPARRPLAAVLVEREQFRSTLDALADCVLVLDREQAIVYANPALEFETQRSAAELRRKSVDQLFCFGDARARQPTPSPVGVCLAEHRVTALPAHSTMAQASGRQLAIEGTVSPLLDGDARLIGAVLVVHEAGPRHRSALDALVPSVRRPSPPLEQLAHGARINTMARMVSGIVREIGAPQTALSHHCQSGLRLLQLAQPDVAQAISAMQAALRQAHAASAIVARLGAFASKAPSAPEMLDLNQLVRHTLELAAHSLHERALSVGLELPVPLPVIACSVELEQVLLTLILAAADAMARAPGACNSITICGRADAAFARVTVGAGVAGMPAELLTELFEPYAATRREDAGLGLAISRAIVEAHGGRLEALGGDAGAVRFRVVLPLARHKPAGSAPA
ncbi:MAG: ATP-binding protein [Pseudomonadota bacterium]